MFKKFSLEIYVESQNASFLPLSILYISSLFPSEIHDIISHCDREYGRGGGLLFSQLLSSLYCPLLDLKIENSIWCTVESIHLVGVIHRSHNSNIMITITKSPMPSEIWKDLWTIPTFCWWEISIFQELIGMITLSSCHGSHKSLAANYSLQLFVTACWMSY